MKIEIDKLKQQDQGLSNGILLCSTTGQIYQNGKCVCPLQGQVFYNGHCQCAGLFMQFDLKQYLQPGLCSKLNQCCQWYGAWSFTQSQNNAGQDYMCADSHYYSVSQCGYLSQNGITQNYNMP
ncbi:Hypothetical_protein [Hexamita inflata]|uniref:Hypothetical_protein n=1 Tax=Hexamita inflata TaxID=28002 RepID=A0AA86UB93_9EUKA|nr:Hypothetical protein HINF_LOCUS36404 [Hexamita inflata]